MRLRQAILLRIQRRSSTDDAFSTAFFEPQEQFDNGAQAQYGAQAQCEAQANVQRSRTEDAEERVQAHEVARAIDQDILTDNGDDKAQAQPS
jgi:hypothetical protein